MLRLHSPSYMVLSSAGSSIPSCHKVTWWGTLWHPLGGRQSQTLPLVRRISSEPSLTVLPSQQLLPYFYLKLSLSMKIPSRLEGSLSPPLKPHHIVSDIMSHLFLVLSQLRA